MTLLHKFAVYNQKFGAREDNEHQKILFYHPSEDSLSVKLKFIGLTEGIIFFTSMFKPTKMCETLNMKETQFAFYSPEPDYTMLLSMVIPKSTNKKTERLPENYLQSILYLAYSLFKLKHGTFSNLSKWPEESGNQALKLALNSFYHPYISNSLNFSHFPFLEVITGVKFLPCERKLHMRIMCFVSQVQSTFPSIKHLQVLYDNDSLIFSTLKPQTTCYLYKLFTRSKGGTFLYYSSIEGPSSSSSNGSHHMRINRKRRGHFINEDGSKQNFEASVKSLFFSFQKKINKNPALLLKTSNMSLTDDSEDHDSDFHSALQSPAVSRHDINSADDDINTIDINTNNIINNNNNVNVNHANEEGSVVIQLINAFDQDNKNENNLDEVRSDFSNDGNDEVDDDHHHAQNKDRYSDDYEYSMRSCPLCVYQCGKIRVVMILDSKINDLKDSISKIGLFKKEFSSFYSEMLSQISLKLDKQASLFNPINSSVDNRYLYHNGVNMSTKSFINMNESKTSANGTDNKLAASKEKLSVEEDTFNNLRWLSSSLEDGEKDGVSEIMENVGSNWIVGKNGDHRKILFVSKQPFRDLSPLHIEEETTNMIKNELGDLYI